MNCITRFILLLAILLTSCKQYYTITTSVQPAEGGGIVMSPSSESVLEETPVTFTAKPNAEYVFTGWSGSFTGTENPKTVTVTSDLNIIANFALKKYPLTIEVEGNGTVSERIVSTKTDYTSGTIIELTAKASDYWLFDHWEGDLSGKENPKSITIDTPKQVKAVFLEHDPGIVFTETEYISPAKLYDIIGMGINLGGHMDGVWQGVAGETYIDGIPISQPLFNKLKEIGFKSVRIPISWVGQFGPSPDFIINEKWLDRIAEYLGYCKTAGLNAIIDFHFDAWRNTDGYMNWEGEKYDMFWLDMAKACLSEEENLIFKRIIHSLWIQIARRFRDEGDYLIFQPFNEPAASPTIWGPNPSNEDAARILTEWNQVFVDAVRSTGGKNADRWLLIPSINAQDISTTVKYLQLPKDYCSNNRLIVSTHCYEPYAFTHHGSEEWGHTAIYTDDSSILYGELYISSLFELLRERFIGKGIPVFLDETGCRNKATERGNRFQEYYIEYICKCAHNNSIPPFIWDHTLISDGFAYIDHHSGAFRANGENVIAHMYKAVYDEDPSYTLISLYESAPFSSDQQEVQIPDIALQQYILEQYDINQDGRITTSEALGVTSIYVSSRNIVTLSGIEAFSHLQYLDCGHNNITNLDLSQNLELISLNCEANPGLTHLDVSMLSSLKYLNVQDCNLSYFDVSHNPLLINYQVNGNPFYCIPDLTQNPNIESIHINTTAGAFYIPGDYFSAFPRLTGVSFAGYDKQSIDFSKNVLLEGVWAYYLPNMEILDLSHSPNLNYVYVPDCPKLKTIIVHPDVNLDNLVVVKGENTTVTHVIASE